MNNKYIKNIKILITTGGSAGHINPGLIISELLIKNNNIIYWVTNSKLDMEYISNYSKNINVFLISIKNFRKLIFIKKIFFIFNLLKSILEALIILIYIKPNLILGMGNYISFPICIVSWILNIPLIIYDQNIKIGYTNLVLNFFFKKIIKGLIIKNNKLIINNPINKEFFNNKINRYLRYKNKNSKKFIIKILILGGSKGSLFLNNNIPYILYNVKKCIIWHQSGINNIEHVFNIYKKLNILNIVYKIDGYINNIYNSYKWADLVICRSGAITISEIIYSKIPSILIPLKTKDNHQYYNALILEKNGSSKIFNEKNIYINFLLYIYIINIIKKKKYILNMYKKILFIKKENSTINFMLNINKLIN